jgi:hypothetical protein
MLFNQPWKLAAVLERVVKVQLELRILVVRDASPYLVFLFGDNEDRVSIMKVECNIHCFVE